MYTRSRTLTRYKSRISGIINISTKISTCKVLNNIHIKHAHIMFGYNTCTLFNQLGIHTFVFKNSNINVCSELLKHAKTAS